MVLLWSLSWFLEWWWLSWEWSTRDSAARASGSNIWWSALRVKPCALTLSTSARSQENRDAITLTEKPSRQCVGRRSRAACSRPKTSHQLEQWDREKRAEAQHSHTTSENGSLKPSRSSQRGFLLCWPGELCDCFPLSPYAGSATEVLVFPPKQEELPENSLASTGSERKTGSLACHQPPHLLLPFHPPPPRLHEVCSTSTSPSASADLTISWSYRFPSSRAIYRPCASDGRAERSVAQQVMCCTLAACADSRDGVV